MDRNRALEVLRGLRADLEARGIVHAGLFGSVGRGDSRAESDVDVVVTPTCGRSLGLIDLGGVQTLLEEGFAGLSVDVVVEPVRASSLREAIARDRVDAF